MCSCYGMIFSLFWDFFEFYKQLENEKERDHVGTPVYIHTGVTIFENRREARINLYHPLTSKWCNVYHLDIHIRGKKLNNWASCLKIDNILCIFSEIDINLFFSQKSYDWRKYKNLPLIAMCLSPGLAVNHLWRSFLGRWVKLLLWSVNTLEVKCCWG